MYLPQSLEVVSYVAWTCVVEFRWCRSRRA